LATLVIDAGIVAVSSVIPDTIEPDFINKAANKRIDQYTEAIVEAIKDPIGVIESVSQTISDTYEEEGIMYVTGNAASSFIPIVGMATKLSKISKLTSKIPDSKPMPVSDTIKVKVDDLVKNNKVFEGFKKGTLQFVKGVKGVAVIFMDGVVGGMKKMVNQDHNVVYSTGGPMPCKVTNPKIVQDRIEDVASKFAMKVESKGTGKETYQHLKDYKNNKYFTRSVEYNAGKDVTGFTYKVYQRGDINWDMARTKGAKKGRGLTNAEASAKYGLAPILDDAGSVATLHHSQQKGVGPLYEASTRYHNISNAKRAPLHPY